MSPTRRRRPHPPVKAAGPSWVVIEKKGRKAFSKGLWAPRETIEAARAALEVERSTEGYAKKRASLAESHEAGLLHRDIKPPNLFACRAADEVDICKLLDFGIVQQLDEPDLRRLGSAAEGQRGVIAEKPVAPASRASKPIIETPKLTQLGAMLGTPGFMSPEQILGMPLDGRADLYALGCVAWWLLTGKEVFARDSGEAKLLHKHITDPVPPLAKMAAAWFPPALEQAIAACLAKDPNDRPANARELAKLLRAIEVPDEHAWTEGRAHAWWTAYRAPQPAPNVPSGEVQVIMPGRTTNDRPIDATGASAFDVTIHGDTGSK